MAELWTCPDCGRRFANPNQWHSCTELSLAAHLATKSGHAVAIYHRVEAALRTCGEFRIHPQTTRVAFIARMTFAGVRLAKRWADLSFILPSPLADRRVRSIEMYGPTSFGHTIRLEDPDALDDDVAGWLCAAHLRGEQETLDPHAHVEGLVGHALEVLMVPIRSKVVDADGTRAIRIPQYAAGAFSEHPYVLARVKGTHHPGEVRRDGEAWVVDVGEVLAESGLGIGDEIDAFLTPDL